MSEHTIKPGDRVWTTKLLVSHQGDDKRGWWVSDGSSAAWWKRTDELLLDSPALPAVARLLAERGDDLAAAVKRVLSLTEIDFTDHDGFAAHEIVTQLAAALEGNDGN